MTNNNIQLILENDGNFYVTLNNRKQQVNKNKIRQLCSSNTLQLYVPRYREPANYSFHKFMHTEGLTDLILCGGISIDNIDEYYKRDLGFCMYMIMGA